MKNTRIMKILTISLAVLALLLLLNTFRLNKKVDEQGGVITQQQLENQKTTKIVNEQGKTISRQKVLLTSSQAVINDLANSVFQLKEKDEKNLNTIAYLKTVQRVRADSIPVPYERNMTLAEKLQLSDSIMAICKDVIDAIDSTTIVVPAVAQVSNDILSAKLTINKESVQIDELTIPDTMSVRFVETKPKLLKPSSIEVQFMHSNPLFQNGQTQSVFYKPKKKSFLRRVILPIAGGVVAGILIGK